MKQGYCFNSQSLLLKMKECGKVQFFYMLDLDMTFKTCCINLIEFFKINIANYMISLWLYVTQYQAVEKKESI